MSSVISLFGLILAAMTIGTWLGGDEFAFAQDEPAHGVSIIVTQDLRTGVRDTLPVSGRVVPLSWSHDGQTLLIIGYSGAASSVLRTWNVDGSAGFFVAGADGDWRADGTLVFAPDFTSGTALQLIQQDGTGLRTLVEFEGVIPESPRWSPDGTQIAFLLDYDYWLVDESAVLRQLTFTSGTIIRRFVSGLQWSPDGQSLIGVEIEGASGSSPGVMMQTSISDSNRDFFFRDGESFDRAVMVFSPDGNWIALSSRSSPPFYDHISIMNLTTRQVIPLLQISTLHPYLQYPPILAWSPTGHYLVAVFQDEILLWDFETSYEARILCTGCRGAAWRP